MHTTAIDTSNSLGTFVIYLNHILLSSASHLKDLRTQSQFYFLWKKLFFMQK